MPRLNEWFADVGEMVQEADTLLTDVYPTKLENEALVTAFYNGADTMDSCEADRRGVHNVTNHLFGYDSINTAVSQIEGLNNREPRLWKFKIDNFDDPRADLWASQMTDHLSRVIRESRRFKNPWRSASGDMVLHGRAVLAYLDKFDWCPQYVRAFVPQRSGTRPEEVPYAFIPRTLSLLDIERFLKQAEKSGSKWNAQALRDAKKAILGNVGANRENLDPLHHGSRDPVEDVLEGHEGDSSSHRLGLPVWYVFSSRPQDKDVPFDLTIVSRAKASIDPHSKQEVPMDRQLFHQEKYHQSANHFLHPFFMEAKRGGDVTWHRVTGLGHLNYDSDLELEEFFNEAMQGSREHLQRLWRVDASADMDRLNQWITGEGASNVVPDGVTMVEQPKNANFPFAFEILNRMEDIGRRHAQGTISNNAQRSSSNELEVQALQRQGRDAQVLGNRLSDIYESLDHLGVQVITRFLMPVPQGPAKDEIAFFQELCENDGIPLAALRKKTKGRYEHIRVRANRGLGDGDRVKEIMGLRILQGMIDQFNPAAQEVIRRKLVEAETGNSEFAEEIVPRPEQPPAEADVVAEQQVTDENYQMEQTGQPVALKVNENAMLHFRGHLQSLVADIQRGQLDGGWRPSELVAFQAKGAHIQETLPNLPLNAQQDAVQALAQITQAAAPLAQVAQQATQGTPENIEMQLKQQKAELDQQKQEALMFERDRRFSLDTAKAASSTEVAAAQISEIERRGVDTQGAMVANVLQQAADFDLKQQQAQAPPAPNGNPI